MPHSKGDVASLCKADERRVFENARAGYPAAVTAMRARGELDAVLGADHVRARRCSGRRAPEEVRGRRCARRQGSSHDDVTVEAFGVRSSGAGSMCRRRVSW